MNNHYAGDKYYFPPKENDRKHIPTADEVTRRSWAHRILDFNDLPPVYHHRMLELVKAPELMPYCALTPTYEGFLRRKNEKLVFEFDRRLFIIERQRSKLIEASFDFENIHYMQLGQVLLKSWLLISGLDQSGELVSTNLSFNTVTTSCFQPFMDSFRGNSPTVDPVSLKNEQAKFNELETVNYKYMNYGRRSIVPGHHLIGYVFQPELQEGFLHLVGKSVLRKKRFLTHLLILTDREVIIVSDDPKSRKISKSSSYGGIWTYIPLSSLQGCKLDENRPGFLDLILKLPHLNRIEVGFESTRRQQLESLFDQVNVRFQA